MFGCFELKGLSTKNVYIERLIYDCDDVMELRELCNDERIQTITMLGDKEWLMPLLASGIKGIDRIVPIGASMDFDLLWDGYDLSERFSRTVTL